MEDSVQQTFPVKLRGERSESHTVKSHDVYPKTLNTPQKSNRNKLELYVKTVDAQKLVWLPESAENVSEIAYPRVSSTICHTFFGKYWIWTWASDKMFTLPCLNLRVSLCYETL